MKSSVLVAILTLVVCNGLCAKPYEMLKRSHEENYQPLLVCELTKQQAHDLLSELVGHNAIPPRTTLYLKLGSNAINTRTSTSFEASAFWIGSLKRDDLIILEDDRNGHLELSLFKTLGNSNPSDEFEEECDTNPLWNDNGWNNEQ